MRGTHAEERLPQLIRLQREEMGWSQEDAAGESRMSKSRWRQIEQGAHAPPDTVARMLDVLGIAPEAAERLGANRAAKALRLRRELLGAGRLPSWIAGEEEAYLWEAPRMTEPERQHLILTLRVMRAGPAPGVPFPALRRGI